MKFVIIDGNAIIHRAYHALPPLTTKDGRMVNAVYGFASMLLKVLQDLKPTHLAVAFDVAGKTFRHVEYDKYKATRVKADQELYDQIPLVHELVSTLGFPIYTKEGYEADDVIGTIVEMFRGDKNKDKELFIVTGDMDTLQLIDGFVKVYTLRKGMSDVVIYDHDGVIEKYGFGPDRVVDYKALRGDTSDNIPGVPGIGEKTATELIQKYGGIEDVYKQLKASGSKLRKEMKEGVIKKLEEGEESAKMSYHLAKIECSVPDLKIDLKDSEIKEFDREKVVKLFQEFEFTSLLKRLPGFGSESAEEKKTSKGKKIKKTAANCENITDKKGLKDLAELIKKENQFVAKVILNNPDVFALDCGGIVFWAGGKGFFVPKNLMADTKDIFEDSKTELIGYDLKQLVKVMCQLGIKIKNQLFDILIASYLLSPGSRNNSLESIILKELGEEIKNGNQGGLFGVEPLTEVETLEKIGRAAEKLRPELKSIDDYGLFQKVEMPLVIVLAEIELNGIALDFDLLKKLSKEVAEEILKLQETIYKLAGQEFNVSSPLQLREILFDKLSLPTDGVKKGKTGLSTSAEELEKLRPLHPIISEIENYRETSKLQNTYIDVLPALVNPKTNRLHTSFNQAVTATGRLSSSDPNLQNIPIRTAAGRKIRAAFVAEKGNVLVSADYSQIELRIAASLAEDQKMLEIFSKDEDIHRATAAAINNVPLDKVTKDMRRAAKEVNFGVLYGMGAYGLSWRADIPQWQAKEFIDKYFSEFSGVKKYLERTLEFTRKEGYCETLFGRRRYIPELNSHNFQLRNAAERMAINHPIQGTAADLMKMAMVAVQEELKEDKEIKMLLQVHDELVFEVKKGEEVKLAKRLKEVMENVAKLRVPIKVEVKFGTNWEEMEGIKI